MIWFLFTSPLCILVEKTFQIGSLHWGKVWQFETSHCSEERGLASISSHKMEVSYFEKFIGKKKSFCFMFHCLELSPLYFLTIKCHELMTLEMGQLISHDNKGTLVLISPGNLFFFFCCQLFFILFILFFCFLSFILFLNFT